MEGPWDVDFSDLLAPAIDRIKGFFKGARRNSSLPSKSTSSDDTVEPSQRGSNEGETGLDADVRGPSVDLPSTDAEFDVDSFLKKKFPWKYGFLDEGQSSVANSAEKPTRNDRF